MIYKVIFLDGTIFESGNSYYDTKWKEIPDKPIKQIIFSLPDNNLLTMRNYESYNNFLEATQDFYGINGLKKGKLKLCYQHIRGRQGNKIISYRISLFQTKDSKFKVGDITRREFEWGKDDNGTPSNGWKKGIK